MSKYNDTQHVYLYMDDSGKISISEDYSIFAGIVFYDKAQKSEFANKYRSIRNAIKCNYCRHNKGECIVNCPEIKGIMLNKRDRRRIIALSKKFTTFGTIIYNKALHADIVRRKQSKGRFTEYAQKRIVKATIKHLISRRIIVPLA